MKKIFKTGRFVFPAVFICVLALAWFAHTFLIPYLSDSLWTGDGALATGKDAGGYPWIGAQNPELVIHEYFDFYCPSCHVAHKNLRRLLLSKKEKIKIIRHDFPRMYCLSNDPDIAKNLCVMAKAATCAGNQGMYWNFNDKAVTYDLFVDTKKISKIHLEIAGLLKLDMTKFNECMVSETTAESLDLKYSNALKKKIRYTPYYIVKGKKLEFKEVVKIIKNL